MRTQLLHKDTKKQPEGPKRIAFIKYSSLSSLMLSYEQWSQKECKNDEKNDNAIDITIPSKKKGMNENGRE